MLIRWHSSIPTVGFNMKRVQKGHVTLKWYVCASCFRWLLQLGDLESCAARWQWSRDADGVQLGSRRATSISFDVGAVLSRCECHRVSRPKARIDRKD